MTIINHTMAEYISHNASMTENQVLSQNALLSGRNDTSLSEFLPFTVETHNGSYRQVLMGYVLPGVIALTTILNIFVCAILVKPTMRSSVNVILAALAISDTMTGLTALPYYAYFYSTGGTHRYVPYHWCYIQKLCSGILPTIFHTISVWLTFTLAVQRYIYLCHSLQAKTLCTIKRMVRVCVAIVILSFVLHSPRLFDSSFVSVSIYSEENGRKIDTCVEVLQDWALYARDVYFSVYYWIRLVTIHLIPTVGLLILNLILIAVIRSSNDRRRRLMLQNRSSEWRRVRETNCSTLLLVVVVTVFIVVEVPMGLFMLLAVVRNQYNYNVIQLDDKQHELLGTIFNFMILLSYPTNFFIYVCMSKQFRSHVIRQISFRKSSRVDTEKTLQTTSTREKSNSTELLKSIFTITAIPLMKSSRRSSATPSNISSKSCSSSTKEPSLVTVKMVELDQQSVMESRVDCTCNCLICMKECRDVAGNTTSNSYVNETYDMT